MVDKGRAYMVGRWMVPIQFLIIEQQRSCDPPLNPGSRMFDCGLAPFCCFLNNTYWGPILPCNSSFLGGRIRATQTSPLCTYRTWVAGGGGARKGPPIVQDVSHSVPLHQSPPTIAGFILHSWPGADFDGPCHVSTCITRASQRTVRPPSALGCIQTRPPSTTIQYTTPLHV